MASRWRYRAAAAAALLAALLLAVACDSSPSNVQQINIPLTVSEEEHKSIYVDNFLNMTENEELNAFEEGVPEMLEASLGEIRTITVVPRDTVQRRLAMSATESDHSALYEAARRFGAQYVLDGWISRDREGRYRIHANLFNLETEEAQQRIAVLEFADREDGLNRLNGFILDIQEKLSQPRSALEGLSEFRVASNYDTHRLYLMGMRSYNRGDPEIAIALLERVLAIERESRAEDPPEAEGSEREKDPTLYLHFILGQLYNEIGNEARAREYLASVYERREDFHPGYHPFIEAIWDEVNGRYGAAREQYAQLIEQDPGEDDYYLRLADITLKMGEPPENAAGILAAGIERFPNAITLYRRHAELQMAARGDEVVGEYAALAHDRSDDPVSNEVASNLIAQRIRQERLQRLAEFEGLAERSAESELLVVRLEGLELELNIDGEEATLSLGDLAALIAEVSQLDAEEEIAAVAGLAGGIASSAELSHRIMAIVRMNEGRYAEAEAFARRIAETDPQRFITLGKVYLRQGQYEQAARTMEEALDTGAELNPLIYYHIANAHLLAGHYREWSRFNRIFREESERLDLIPPPPPEPPAEAVPRTPSQDE